MILKHVLRLMPSYRTVHLSFSNLRLQQGLTVSKEVAVWTRNMVCMEIIWARNYSSKRKPVKKKDEKVVSRILKPKSKPVEVWKGITVGQLARAADRSVDDVFEAMFYCEDCDIYDRETSAISDIRAIQDIMKKMGERVVFISQPAKQEAEEVNKDAIKRPPADPKDLVKRPPVVTIMGHVDHGKTTLLDTLRHSSIVEQEFGGITQHIGAFLVKVGDKDTVCFLDTPGHAAFSAMRSRGANATDIVILVVAADDGVMEQTVESIKYAKAAKVPIIVAINKMDKATADPERVKDELVQHGVQVEDRGGDVQAIPISAKKGDNLDSLVESVLTLAEVLEVRGDPKGLVEGVVIEACVDARRGKLATVLVQRGTLQRGNYLVVGSTWAKVRAMYNEHGQNLSSASPGTPVQVVGWRETLPSAGDVVLQVETESRAHEVIRYRRDLELERQAKTALPAIEQKRMEHMAAHKERLAERLAKGRATYRGISKELEPVTESTVPACYVIIKGDVDGSVDAILDMLETYKGHDKCRLEVVHFGVGKVTPGDIDLADPFQAIIYAFNVGISSEAVPLVAAKNPTIKNFNVIYKLYDDMKEEINKRILPVDKDEIMGEAEVLQEFKVSERRKKVPVAGCHCTKGLLKKSEMFRVLRNDEVIYDGKVLSMYHLKNEVESIKKDVECGIKFDNKELHFQPGDIIHCYHIVPEKRFTDWDPGF